MIPGGPAQPNPTPEAPSLASLLWRASLAACFLLVILFAAHPINDGDLGFHLRCGQWILEHQSFPSTDIFTTTTEGRPFLDIHWFYQVCLFVLYRLGSYQWVGLFHLLLTLGAFFLATQRLRVSRASKALSAFLLLAAALACEMRFRARPETASLFFLCLVLWILEERFHRQKDLLFLLPGVLLLWVNFEGLFILGWGAMGIYLLSGFLRDRRWDPKLLRFSLGAAALCLLNPYFFKGLLFPLSDLGTLSDPLTRNSIKELQSPWLSTIHLFSAPTLYLFIYKIFFLLLLILLLATYRRRKGHELLLAALFGGLSLFTFRNIPLFIFACLPVMAACVEDLSVDWFQRFRGWAASQPLVPGLFLLVVLGLALRVLTGAYYLSDRRTEKVGLGLDLHSLPIRACDFLVQNHLEGKLLNQLDDGGWLEFKVPQKVFTDCRLAYFSEYMTSMAPGGLERLVLQHKPDILFFNCLNDAWIAQLHSMTAWRLVYLDDVTAVYLRAGYADSMPGLDFNRLTERAGVSPAILSEIPSLFQTPPPAAWKCFVEDFYRKADFPSDLLRLGIFCGYSGHPETAEKFFWEGIRRTQGRFYDFYYNLGLLYFYGGKKDEAVACMKRVLMDQPDNDAARQIVENPSRP